MKNCGQFTSEEQRNIEQLFSPTYYSSELNQYCVVKNIFNYQIVKWGFFFLRRGKKHID